MPSVVALGDSVTVGVGDVGSPAGWAAHVAYALEAGDFTNVARLGARARDVTLEQMPLATLKRPDLATLLVGGNDVLRGDFSAQQVGAHVERTVDVMARQGSDLVVVLLHDPRPTLPGPRIVGEVLAERAAMVNEAVLSRIAGAPRLVTVDPARSPFTSTRAAWSVDRLHPSAAGHRALARMVLEALAPLGWSGVRPIAEPTEPQPNGWQRAWWLARYGTPWFAKRSRDLLPELALVCWQHRRRRRVASCVST